MNTREVIKKSKLENLVLDLVFVEYSFFSPLLSIFLPFPFLPPLFLLFLPSLFLFIFFLLFPIGLHTVAGISIRVVATLFLWLLLGLQV